MRYRALHKKSKSILAGISVMLFIYLPSSALYAQQDPQFSMYMFDKMAINPAAAGSKGLLEANVISRLQWMDIQGAPVTNALLISAPVNNKKICWGAEVMNDRLGPANTTSIQGNYAYNIPIGSGKLALGLGIGIYNYNIDWSKIDYKDKTDIYPTSANPNKLAPTAEAGAYYHTESYYLGLSFNHLIQSKITDITTDSTATFKGHIYFIAGKAFQSSSGNVIWNPSVIIQIAPNAPPATSLNLNVLLANKLWVGASIKLNYGFVFMVAYKATNNLSIGYAYDLGINNIGVLGGGSHELSLSFDFASHKLQQVSPRYF